MNSYVLTSKFNVISISKSGFDEAHLGSRKGDLSSTTEQIQIKRCHVGSKNGPLETLAEIKTDLPDMKINIPGQNLSKSC